MYPKGFHAFLRVGEVTVLAWILFLGGQLILFYFVLNSEHNANVVEISMEHVKHHKGSHVIHCI